MRKYIYFLTAVTILLGFTIKNFLIILEATLVDGTKITWTGATDTSGGLEVNYLDHTELV